MEDQRKAEFLASLPTVDRTQIQAGYSLDLVKRAQEEEQQQQALSNGHEPITNGYEPATNGDRYHKIEEGGGATATDHQETVRKPPFWRTTKGILILVALAVIIIGAIVGGAVGGTRSKKTGGSQTGSDGSSGLGPNNSNSNQGTSSGSSDGSG
ncbi:hypothetical protein FS837_008711 [Tulasnella sp. UAMH 9824]|nr:hypothetical protein FS837_008711 [Tulasnella sp. UAMH 9824]